MRLLDIFKKNKTKDFSYIDSINKAKEEYNKGNLEKMYLLSQVFGGEDNEVNTIYVPLGVNKLKEEYDNMVVELVKEGKVKSFNCKPEYKGKSVIPSKITLISSKDGVEVFKNTINIW